MTFKTSFLACLQGWVGQLALHEPIWDLGQRAPRAYPILDPTNI